jgi:hypothetical protein
MMGKATVLIVVAALAACVLAGCSNKVTIEEGKAKIEELASKGVPEREMSSLRMYLFHMETAKRTGNSSQFRVYQDSLTRALSDFEGKMGAILEESGPFMDSLRGTFDERIALLKGLHLESVEKRVASLDSLKQIGSQKLLARNRLESFSLDLDTLVIMQRLADSLRGQFVGIWVMEMESPDPSQKVVERTEIHMRADGTLFIMEGKRSNTPDFREDWLFESYGTWDLRGDVAHHYVTREKRVRQIFEAVDPQTGRWRREAQPPFDSTVAKGTKDRYADWAALNKDYQRFPIRGRR